MKRIIYLLFIISIVVSCRSTRNLEGIVIYECERVGEIFPSYIILKGGALKQCDFIWYSYGTIGNYVVNKDTLYVFPKYTYYSDSILCTNTSDIKPQKFLMQKNCLVDVTDYTLDIINDTTDFYINEFFKSLPNTVYKRLKIKGK